MLNPDHVQLVYHGEWSFLPAVEVKDPNPGSTLVVTTGEHHEPTATWNEGHCRTTIRTRGVQDSSTGVIQPPKLLSDKSLLETEWLFYRTPKVGLSHLGKTGCRQENPMRTAQLQVLIEPHNSFRSQ